MLPRFFPYVFYLPFIYALIINHGISGCQLSIMAFRSHLSLCFVLIICCNEYNEVNKNRTDNFIANVRPANIEQSFVVSMLGSSKLIQLSPSTKVSIPEFILTRHIIYLNPGLYVIHKYMIAHSVPIIFNRICFHLDTPG